MPMREIRYDPNMPGNKSQAEDAVRNMGSAGYIVLPVGAELVLHQGAGNAGADTYSLLDDTLDKKLSVLVLGNTMTTEDGSSHSQARVHMEVEHELATADQIMIEYILNFQLKNMLEQHGYNTGEGYFKFDDSERLSLTDRAEIDLKIAAQVPIDPAYFYETYGLPAPKTKTTQPTKEKEEGKKTLSTGEKLSLLVERAITKAIREAATLETLSSFLL